MQETRKHRKEESQGGREKVGRSRAGYGCYVEFLEFVEARDGDGDEIWILRGHGNGVLSPIDVSVDTAISCDVFCEIDAMSE